MLLFLSPKIYQSEATLESQTILFVFGLLVLDTNLTELRAVTDQDSHLHTLREEYVI